MSDRLLFCIFSFNRGRFLEHCVNTIEQCVPDADIAIFDDDSFDVYTQGVLSRLADTHHVLQPGNQSSHKLGGLYGNMQSALEFAADRSLVCFLQDDMQVVRPLAQEEIKKFDHTFNENPDLAFLHPCFLKGVNRSRDEATLEFDRRSQLYYRKEDTGQSAGSYFSAILIVRPCRLLDKGWKFKRNEPENDRQARECFGRIGHLYAPFAMWLPEVPAYRGKRKTLALKIAEKQRGSGFYPYKIMSDDEVQNLNSRDFTVLPIAEDFLQCEKRSLPQPWGYYPMQGNRLLKKLNTLELSIRKILGMR